MSNRNYNNQTNPNRQKLMNGGRTKKMGGGMMMMKRPMMQKGGSLKGEAKVKAIYESVRDKNQPMKLQRMKDKFRAKKIKERMGKKMGGSFKPVDPKTQKGLSKLPTEVRNKMGYMKKGGMVPNKKYIKKVAKELRRK